MEDESMAGINEERSASPPQSCGEGPGSTELEGTSAPAFALQARVQTFLAAFPNREPVVVVPIDDPYDDVLWCVERLLAHTPVTVPLLVLDTPENDPYTGQLLTEIPEANRLCYIRSAGEHTVTRALAWCAPRDVILLASNMHVPAEWLPRLRRAAYWRSNIATVTPLANDGQFLSVPVRNVSQQWLPGGMTPAQADARIMAAAAEQIYPIIPAPVNHCIYITRAALAIVGGLDESFADEVGAIGDFAQRAVIHGFAHVAADDLFVYARTPRNQRNEPTSTSAGILTARYPWYTRWCVTAAQGMRTPLAVALDRARIALTGHRVAIDARSITGVVNGTQVVTLELARALASHPDRPEHLTLIVGDGVPTDALMGVDQLYDAVLPVSRLDADAPEYFDLVHRPFQTPAVTDIAFLQRIAARFVITHLDCIAYANPGYATDVDSWEHLRYAMRLGFALADGVTFLSEDAARDAAHQGLTLPEERICVASTGINHGLLASDGEPPADAETWGRFPFILVIGANYRHKNRIASVRLLRRLIEAHNWSGHLVFAGPDVGFAGSGGEEAAELLRAPELRTHIHELGVVNEREKRWLYEHAALVFYPSVYEGFGLVPFEAAMVGTPTLTLPATAVREVLGDDVTYLDPVDPVGESIVWAMLTDPDCRTAQVTAINARALHYTWECVADHTLQFYHHLLRLPPRTPAGDVLEEAARVVTRTEGERRALFHETAAVNEELRHTREWVESTIAHARRVDEHAANVLQHAERVERWGHEQEAHARALENELTHLRTRATGVSQ